MRTVHACLLLAAMIAIAGCSTAGSGEHQTSTLTPAPVPESTPAPTTRPDLAPGVTDDGVERPLDLVRRHAAILRNTSYTVRTVRTERTADGEHRRRAEMTARFAATKTRYRQVFERVSGRNDAATEHWERYANGERLYEAIRWNTTTKYYVPRETVRARAYPDRLMGDPVRQEELYVMLTALNTTVDGTVTRNGTGLHRVTATGVAEPAFLAAWTYVDEIERVSLTLLVSPNGLIREYRFAYTSIDSRQRSRVVETVRYSGIGTTTVEEPPWYDDAVENVTSIG